MADSFVRDWDTVLSTPGAARNPDIASWAQRALLGDMCLHAAHHPQHAALKRPASIPINTPQSVLPVVRDFNKEGFNFTKVAAKEIVAVFVAGSAVDGDKVISRPAHYSSTSLLEACSGGHPVFINASPFGRGHSLFVPSIFDCNPQIVQTNALALACRLSLAMLRTGCSADMRMGYNSLGAFASVNHCHFHVWFNKELWRGEVLMPVERAPRHTLFTRQECELTLCRVQWPVPCFLLHALAGTWGRAGPALSTCMAVLESVLRLMQSQAIPHHLALWWSRGEAEQEGLRLHVLIIPRTQQAPALGGALSVALLECCGLATIQSIGQEGGGEGGSYTGMELFRTLTEADVVRALAQFAVSNSVLEDIVHAAASASASESQMLK